MLYQVPPSDFSPQFNVAACCLEYNGKILVLLRQDHANRGNTWGFPAGKMEQNETIEDAMSRELLEETGVKVLSNQFHNPIKMYIRFPEFDFIIYLFKYSLEKAEEVVINPDEHKAYKWVTPQEVLIMKNKLEHLDDGVKLCYKI